MSEQSLSPERRRLTMICSHLIVRVDSTNGLKARWQITGGAVGSNRPALAIVREYSTFMLLQMKDWDK